VQTTHESEMALFNECMQSCAHIVLDIADIVREGDFATLMSNGWRTPPYRLVCNSVLRLYKLLLPIPVDQLQRSTRASCKDLNIGWV